MRAARGGDITERSSAPVTAAEDVRPACAGGSYTCLSLTWGDTAWVAVPIAARVGGLLLAVPGAAIPEEDREAAATAVAKQVTSKVS